MKVYGAFLEALQETKCKKILSWILGEEAPNDLNITFRWALLFCFDGVVWGRLKKDRWLLSSLFFPKLSPEPSEEKLLELRVFGPEAEVLIWRSGGVFKGRLLKDKDDSFEPFSESRILLGNRLLEEPKEAFSHVGSPDGREQVVPIRCSKEDFKDGRWPLRLEIKHYFSQDEETGVLRIAASRLVDVYKEDQNGT